MAFVYSGRFVSPLSKSLLRQHVLVPATSPLVQPLMSQSITKAVRSYWSMIPMNIQKTTSIFSSACSTFQPSMFASTMRKRVAKMNKHKLKKRRKKERLKSTSVNN
mmetsp:Transcript_20789/g.24573  ORF Transcript_20789/g.24573 Transcript_20789/m.24573 type:complete len:106 (-) Transcript_20789:182-499(-)